MLTSLVYLSTATPGLSRSDLHQILTRSRAHNLATEITGLLLFGHGRFVQLLEGEQGAVDDLYAAIRHDPRHHDVTTVRSRPEERRQFPDWRMGFGDLDVGGVATSPLVVIAGDQVDPADADVILLRELLEIFDSSG